MYLGFKRFYQFSGQSEPYLPQTAVSHRTVPPTMRLALRATTASTSTRQAITVGGCSQTAGNQCDKVKTHAANVPNPLSGLDSAMKSLKTSDFSGPCTNPDAKGKPQPALKAYSATPSATTGPCYNTVSSNGPLNGTYFFNGNVSIGDVTGTATLILFGAATLNN